jgi:DNA repair exonuclease SbcCD ATPase subunit
MSDEKDRLTDKLRQKEKAEEDRFFADQDKAALEKLRQAQRTASEEQVRELARDRCPRCGERLGVLKLHGVEVAECPMGHGMWLDNGELEQIASREKDSWLGRFFYRPRRVI